MSFLCDNPRVQKIIFEYKARLLMAWVRQLKRQGSNENNLCPVHLPGKNIFCPGQNIFCTGQNNFCPRQNIFVLDKNFCPRLKSSYLLGKRIENDFKLWRNFFPWLKSYFPSISQAKMYFLAQDKIFCPGQKCFVQDKNYFVRYKNYFVWDKKYFVQADGLGISFLMPRISIF